MWKIMGINSGDDTRYGDINGWFGLNAVDGDHKTKPAAGCMVIATRIKHDLDSECSILLRCCRSVGLLLVAIGLRLVVQLSGYWQVLKTVELQWNALIIVIPFAIVVRCAQLQPTTFKWTDQPCHATHSLIASTCMDMLLEFLLAGRAIGTSWTWCDIGNLHCSPGSTSFAIPDWKMLITVNCDFARVHFRWTITVQQSTSSVLFLASLDGRAEIYHQLQGNYHCPELMHWSFSQSLMLPEDLFYTPGYILVCCCALMQWKIPWITRLVSWKSYFRCCRAEHGPLYSYEYFQWTNSHSCPWLFNCLLLVKVVELKPLPSWGLLLCSYVVNKNLDIFRESLHSFGNVQWTISCCSFSVLDGCSAVPIFVWLELKIKSSQGSHVEFNSSNRNGKLHDLVEMVEPKPWSPALTSCLCGALCILISSVLTLKCIYSKYSPYLEVPIWNAICIMFSTSKKLHARESYWLLGLYSSCDPLVSENATYFGSETLEWKIPWYFCPCHAVSSSNRLEMQLVGGHSKISVAFSFCWAKSSTIHSVIYLPGACIIQWGSEMMSWENASSNDGIFSCVKRVLITLWDPGGSSWHRLEVKPKFKEGGMLATFPIVTVGSTMGCLSWAWADRKALKATATYTWELATVDLALERTASAS